MPSIIQTNRERGMLTLNDSLLDLVHRALVEPEEAYRKSTDKDGIASALKARGHELPFLA